MATIITFLPTRTYMNYINRRNLYIRIGFALLIGVAAVIGIAGTPALSGSPYQDGFEENPFTTQKVADHVVETATSENYRIVYSDLEQSSTGQSTATTMFHVSNVDDKAYFKSPSEEIYQDGDDVYTLNDGEVTFRSADNLEAPPLTNQIVYGESIGIPEYSNYRFAGQGTQEDGSYKYRLDGVNPFLFEDISTINSASGEITVEESSRISSITISIEARTMDGGLSYRQQRYTTQVEDVFPPQEPQWVTEYKLENDIDDSSEESSA
jgi:hypothetical protein